MPIEGKITERRLQEAYLAILGDPRGVLSTDQQLVWADLESFCHAYRTLPERLSGGELSERALFMNEGRRTYWLRARGQVLAATLPKPEPIKISRKRKPATEPS